MSKVCDKHGVEYVSYSGRMRCPECSRESYHRYNTKNAKHRKRWHQSEAGKTSRRKYEKSDKGKACRLRENHKILARKAVLRAVKKGIIVIPDMCSKCLSQTKLESHHHLGYTEEHQLDVLWLCSSCHVASHGKKVVD